MPNSQLPTSLQVLSWVVIGLGAVLIGDGIVSLVRGRPGFQLGRRRVLRWRPMSWSRICIGTFVVLSSGAQVAGVSADLQLLLGYLMFALLALALILQMLATGRGWMPTWPVPSSSAGPAGYRQRYARRWKRTVIAVGAVILVLDLVVMVVSVVTADPSDGLEWFEGLVMIPVSLLFGAVSWGSLINLIVAIPGHHRGARPAGDAPNPA